MSNLGAYQMVTTGIKALGGPGPAIAKATGVIMLGGGRCQWVVAMSWLNASVGVR